MFGGVELKAAVQMVDAVGLDEIVVEVVEPEVGDAFAGEVCVVRARKGFLRVFRGHDSGEGLRGRCRGRWRAPA
jgi:hypothetical protein